MLDYDEASDLYALFCIGVSTSLCRDVWLGAVAGKHATADMARSGAGCQASPGDGGGCDSGYPLVGCRPALGWGDPRIATYDDSLFASGKEYRHCRCRVPRRGIHDSGHRS
jgi:hypothetical protein